MRVVLVRSRASGAAASAGPRASPRTWHVRAPRARATCWRISSSSRPGARVSVELPRARRPARATEGARSPEPLHGGLLQRGGPARTPTCPTPSGRTGPDRGAAGTGAAAHRRGSRRGARRHPGPGAGPAAGADRHGRDPGRRHSGPGPGHGQPGAHGAADAGSSGSSASTTSTRKPPDRRRCHAGRLRPHGGSGPSALKPIPAGLVRSPPPGEGQSRRATTLTEVFLARPRAASRPRPRRPIRPAGVKTYRDVLTGILALRPAIAALEGHLRGPHAAGLGRRPSTLYLALLFAGKIPVMVNWTVGRPEPGPRPGPPGGEARAHRRRSWWPRWSPRARISRRIKDRLRAPGGAWASASAQGAKLLALLKARLNWSRRCAEAPVHETAVVLFTSGSESLPKAVPLTHANLLANCPGLWRASSPSARRADDRHPAALPLLRPHLHRRSCRFCSGVPGGLPPQSHGGRAPWPGSSRPTASPCWWARPPSSRASSGPPADEQLASPCGPSSPGAEKCPEALYEVAGPPLAEADGAGGLRHHRVLAGGQRQHRGGPAPRQHRRDAAPPWSTPSWTWTPASGWSPGKAGMLLVRGPSIFGGYLHYDGPSPFRTSRGSPGTAPGTWCARSRTASLTSPAA